MGRLGWARLLIGLVAFFNLQCAVVFLVAPHQYAPAFELSGPVGAAAVRGFGVLFLMWNIPYLVALWHPLRHRLALGEAVVMQTVGLVGESLIYAGLPAVHAVLQASLNRFIWFDALGLAALLGAAALIRRSLSQP